MQGLPRRSAGRSALLEFRNSSGSAWLAKPLATQWEMVRNNAKHIFPLCVCVWTFQSFRKCSCHKQCGYEPQAPWNFKLSVSLDFHSSNSFLSNLSNLTANTFCNIALLIGCNVLSRFALPQCKDVYPYSILPLFDNRPSRNEQIRNPETRQKTQDWMLELIIMPEFVPSQ